MFRPLLRRASAAVAASAIAVTSIGGVSGAAPPDPIPATGPSTSVNPYIVPVGAGTQVMSLLTVNDPTSGAGNGYKMVGIPDGLGATAANGVIDLRMSHELGATAGAVRSHASKGAFVSRWSIDANTLAVTGGQDYVPSASAIQLYTYGTDTYSTGTTAWGRFCSGDLVGPAQLFNGTSGNGYNGSLYFTGEEIGTEGRGFGFDEAGNAKQLPRLGLLSFENTLVATTANDSTVAISTPDATPGYLRLYQGTKQSTGDAFDKAGLTNGALSSIAVAAPGGGTLADDDAYRVAYPKGTTATFTTVGVNWNQTGAAQNTQAAGAGALAFTRPEDGAWDPNNPNDFYFVTTEKKSPSGSPRGALWRLRFTDVKNPSAGGSITMLLDGSEGMYKPDNITIDVNGNLLIQEDPGNVNPLAKVFSYRISDGTLVPIAQFDSAQFAPGAPNLLTIDEESSGIIDATNLIGAGWFLLDAQVHTVNGNTTIPALGQNQGELVEHGQLLAMKVDFATVYGQNPLPVIPETPYVWLLPLAALPAVYLALRRRSTNQLAV